MCLVVDWAKLGECSNFTQFIKMIKVDGWCAKSANSNFIKMDDEEQEEEEVRVRARRLERREESSAKGLFLSALHRPRVTRRNRRDKVAFLLKGGGCRWRLEVW